MVRRTWGTEEASMSARAVTIDEEGQRQPEKLKLRCFSGRLRTFAMLLLTSLGFVYLCFWTLHASASRFTANTIVKSRGQITQTDRTMTLQESALREILLRGAPILGYDEGCSRHSATCDWMSKVPDSTKLVHMNLPGTHDAATGNYSDARQASLLRYTGPLPPADVYRCQQRSIFQMLNDGIRVFDLRYAYNPGNDTIGFWHSKALLAPTTSILDVLFGFYSWLDRHPTETVLLSFNHEGGTGTLKDEKLQTMIRDLFSKASNGHDPNNTFLKKKYWVQTQGELGTLGEYRGKIVLLQRFSYDLLSPPPAQDQLIGIQLEASRWTDNGKDIKLVYNDQTNDAAFIEDYYRITLPDGTPSSTDAYITSKFNATTAHLERAMSSTEDPDQLYITFASAAFLQDEALQGGVMFPKTYALGNGTDIPGMNQRLLPWLKERKGKRLGIILLDFYDAVPGLVEAVIGI